MGVSGPLVFIVLCSFAVMGLGWVKRLRILPGLSGDVLSPCWWQCVYCWKGQKRNCAEGKRKETFQLKTIVYLLTQASSKWPSVQ